MASMITETESISLLGTTALLFDVPGEMNLLTQQRLWSLALEAEAWPEVREAVPGMNNLMLTFTRAPSALAQIETRLREAWRAATPLSREGGSSSCRSSMAAHSARTWPTSSTIPACRWTRSSSATARRTITSSRWAVTPATAISAGWTRALPRRGARCRC